MVYCAKTDICNNCGNIPGCDECEDCNVQNICLTAEYCDDCPLYETEEEEDD